MSKITASIKAEILSYSRFMSLDAAAAKVKRNNLGRLDAWVNEAMAIIAKENAQ